jgi:hypothetical protein
VRIIQARHEHRLADHQRRIAAHHRQIDGVDVGQAIEADAEHEGEHRARPEIAVAKGGKVDNRLARRSHPPEESDAADRRDDDRDRHRLTLEPVLGRPLFERVFQRPKEAGHRDEADIVEVGEQRIVGLVKVDQKPGRDRDDDAWTKIDQEQPVPGKPVGEIAADRRADRWRKGRHEADDRGDERLLVARKDGEGGGKNGRNHAAADEALEGPPHDHLLDRVGVGAHEAHEREAAGGNGENDAG